MRFVCGKHFHRVRRITAAVEADLYDVVNKMMTGSLTMTLLEKTGHSRMSLDEMIRLLGNHKETMLLRCKWGEDECGVDNFTTITTDHGLCFTFNGPNSNRDLRVHTPEDYPVKAEQNCQCSVPCEYDFVETTYSYAQLSKSAIDKIHQEDINRILPRYKKALDVYEYKNERNQHKKKNYQEFSESLRTVTHLYRVTISMLKESKRNIEKLQKFMLDVYQIKTDYLWAQSYIVKKNFVEAKNEMDETTLGELADDLYVFRYITERKIMELAAATDKSVKEVQYKLLTEQLMARIWLAELSLKNLTQLVSAYTTGDPIFNNSLPEDTNFTMLIPRELLKKAINKSENGSKIVLSAHKHITQIAVILRKLMNISHAVYETEIITQEQTNS
ncbi:unnamed protein product, partial [Candidula unifasciata]